MKAHEKKKAYRLYCSKRLKAGEAPDPATGNWGSNKNCSLSTQSSLRDGAHGNR
jgi:hypothetical protein